MINSSDDEKNDEFLSQPVCKSVKNSNGVSTIYYSNDNKLITINLTIPGSYY